jgi:hypothetical protein
MSLESDGGMILTGENRGTRRKTCPSATLSTTNPTWIDLGANPGLRGERPATNDLSHGTANFTRVTGGKRKKCEKLNFSCEISRRRVRSLSVFWDVAPCNHVEVTALMMEAVRTFETSVHFNVTTRLYIPDDPKLN